MFHVRSYFDWQPRCVLLQRRGVPRDQSSESGEQSVCDILLCSSLGKKGCRMYKTNTRDSCHFFYAQHIHISPCFISYCREQIIRSLEVGHQASLEEIIDCKGKRSGLG